MPCRSSLCQCPPLASPLPSLQVCKLIANAPNRRPKFDCWSLSGENWRAIAIMVRSPVLLSPTILTSLGFFPHPLGGWAASDITKSLVPTFRHLDSLSLSVPDYVLPTFQRLVSPPQRPPLSSHRRAFPICATLRSTASGSPYTTGVLSRCCSHAYLRRNSYRYALLPSLGQAPDHGCWSDPHHSQLEGGLC